MDEIEDENVVYEVIANMIGRKYIAFYVNTLFVYFLYMLIWNVKYSFLYLKNTLLER